MSAVVPGLLMAPPPEPVPPEPPVPELVPELLVCELLAGGAPLLQPRASTALSASTRTNAVTGRSLRVRASNNRNAHPAKLNSVPGRNQLASCRPIVGARRADRAVVADY